MNSKPQPEKPEPSFSSLSDNMSPASAEPGGEVYQWRRWYGAVLGALAVEILFFTYLTHFFS